MWFRGTTRRDSRVLWVNIDLIMTAPSVVYHINTTDGKREVANPSEFPDPTRVVNIEEPFVSTNYGASRLCWCRNGLAQRKRVL